MQDELNQPLGLRPRPAPLQSRLRPLAVWGGRLVLVAVALGAAALYWRETTPAAPEVAVIPFEAIKTAAPAPAPAASPSTIAVFPAPAEGGVSVIRNNSAPAGAHAPQIINVAEALGRLPPSGPDPRLSEGSKYGALPRIGSNGARPSDAYARPYAESATARGAPRIAVFVGGVGLDPQATEAAVSRLPGAVSLGVAPYGADLATVVSSARGAGHEIWLQAPMEGFAGADPGPHTLKTGASEAENLDALHWLMARFPGYVGVANYLGAKFTADADAVSPVLAEIARRGLLYLDDGSSALSKAPDLAPGLDLKAGHADATAAGDAAALDAAFALAEDIARRRGSAILVASALPATLDRLAPWASGLERKGFALAPVSALVTARPDRAARANP